MKHLCDNCGQTFAGKKLKQIKDLLQRVEPGGIVPSGECPECGALCYPEKETRRYVLQVVGDVEPKLNGPYASEKARDRAARKLRKETGGEDGIYSLDVRADWTPEVGAYSAGFMSG